MDEDSLLGFAEPTLAGSPVHEEPVLRAGEDHAHAGVTNGRKPQVLVPPDISLPPEKGGSPAGQAGKLEVRNPSFHHLGILPWRTLLDSGKSEDQTDRGHGVGVAHPAIETDKGFGKGVGEILIPPGHHQGGGHGTGTGGDVRAPRSPGGIAQRPGLAIQGLAHLGKGILPGLFIDRVSAFLGQSPGQVGLDVDYDQPASAVRDGVVVTHGSFLGHPLGQQIATFLELPEVRFVSGGQLILPQKDSIGRRLPVFGSDLRGVWIDGIDAGSLYEFDPPLDGGQVGRIIVGEQDQPAECGGVNVRIPPYTRLPATVLFLDLDEMTGDFSKVVLSFWACEWTGKGKGRTLWQID
jgi:hypothetical protein